MSAADPGRFLIATGTQHYDDGDELATVPGDLSAIAEFFREFDYREELDEIRLDPASAELRTALSRWLTSGERRVSDTAVIYYSGHGDIQGDSFYMLTADSRVNEYPASALRADFVLDALGDSPKVRKVLLLLDTCYSGQGGFDVAAAAARVARLHSWGDGEGVWVVAAAGSKQEAEEAHFVSAFTEAARQLQATTGKLQPYIGLEWLIEQTNQILKRRGRSQLARYIPVTQATGLAPFIPNPQYEPDAPANIDLETRAWRAAELAGHWDPKARGVEVAVQAGWYFTGRQAALDELAGWLADADGDARVRIVTGRPGSGKSAVLGRIVTLAGPGPSRPGAAVAPGTRPATRVPPVAAALLAKGKTAEELLRELVEALDLGDGKRFPDALESEPVRRIIIDALDEASDPPAVIEKVILPLHGAASPGRGPRITVGARPHQSLLGLLPAGSVTIDLDAHPYRQPTDVSEYVTKLLLAAGDPGSRSPYRDSAALAGAAAGEVARIAGSSFLVAQIAARTLARLPRPLTPAEIAADRDQWRDVGAAFDRDLARYGGQARRVRDLLAPLAWSEGTGLPRELWAPLATALSGGRAYADADVSWLIEEAGVFLVEALDSERSVYRLYHQQLAEHLRAGRVPRDTQQLIATELLRHVPDGLGGSRDWAAAAPYVRVHLATHAAAAGVLDDLLTDPGFLRAAAPDRLLPAIDAAVTTDGRRAGEAYRRALPWLGQGASQLSLAALQVGAQRLADRLPASLTLEWPAGTWRPAWAWWRRPTPARAIGAFNEGRARAVVVLRTDECTVAVVALPDRVESWDIERGERLAQRPVPALVNCMAPCSVNGAAAVAAGDDDGRLAVLSVPGLELLAERGDAHSAEIQAIAAVDAPACIATGDQEGSLALWSLPGLEEVARQPAAHTWVRHLALVRAGGESVIVSAGDWAPLEEGQPTDIPTLRAWTIPGLRPYASWAEEFRLVMFMGVLEAGTSTAVLADSHGDAEVWLLDSRKQRFRRVHTLREAGFTGLLKLSEDSYLVIGINTMTPLSVKRGALGSLKLGSPVETEDAHWAGPVETGQGTVVVSASRLLRSWTADDLLEESRTAAKRPASGPGEHYLTHLASQQNVIYAYALDGSVKSWGTESGTPGSLRTAFESPVTGLSAISVNGVPHVVAGQRNGQVLLVDGHTGKVRWRVEAGRRVLTTRTVALGGRPVALVAVELDWNLYVGRMWDLASGSEIETRDLDDPDLPDGFGPVTAGRQGTEWNLAVAGYRRDKEIADLATCDTPDGPLAAAASPAGVIPVWSLTDQRHVAELQTGQLGTSALTFAPGRAFAAGPTGELQVWHTSAWLTARRDKRQPAARVSVMNAGTVPMFGPAARVDRAHYGRVTALASGTWGDEACAVSGGADGRLRSWGLDGEPLATVDIGEPVTALTALDGGRYAAGTSHGLVVIETR